MTPCIKCGFSADNLNTQTGGVASDPRRHLEQLNSQIGQAEALLAQLREQVVIAKRRINSRLSPILQLPPDITSEIFMACLPEFAFGRADWPTRRRVPGVSMPLLIGRVCRAWRDFAWSTPKLWSRISLCLQHSSPKDCELLEGWLARSGQSPLSIHLYYLSHYVDGAEGRIGSILRLIANCSERWRHIYFHLPVYVLKALEGVRNRLPRLTYMSLILPREEVPTKRCEGFSAAPQLRHVEVDGYNQRLLNLSLSQVTRLSLAPVEVGNCLDILKCCPNLTHCTFKGVAEFTTAHLLPPVVSPSVEYLELESGLGRFPALSLSRLLDALTLPTLCELRLNTNLHALPHTSLLSLVSRSACSVKRLTLTACYIESGKLRACLTGIHSIVELEVTNCVNSSIPVISLLHPAHASNMDSIILPNLRTLKLLTEDRVNFGDLASMLEARGKSTSGELYPGRGDVARLRDVIVTAGDDCGPDAGVLEQLRHLVAGGMEISLKRIARCNDWATVLNPRTGNLR